jgi:hypothetical protein
MFDHADEIAAALVLCLAAGYSLGAISAWRGARRLRRDIDDLDSQGRQIFASIVNEQPIPTTMLSVGTSQIPTVERQHEVQTAQHGLIPRGGLARDRWADPRSL